jgi:long-subunit fatty acid transport protein
VIGNFTANSFSRDEIGAGVEYSFKEMFTVRGAYKYELGSFGNNNIIQNPVNTGITAGVSFDVPFAKDSDTKLSVDYGYMNTRVWNGTHNVTLRLTL